MIHRFILTIHYFAWICAIAIAIIPSMFFYDQIIGGYTIIAGIAFKDLQFFHWGFSVFIIVISSLLRWILTGKWSWLPWGH